MNCVEVQDYLLDYMDNELPASFATDIEHHLRCCSACRESLENYRKTRLIVQLRAVPEPPADYWDETWQRIRERSRASLLQLPSALSKDQVAVADNAAWRRLAAAAVLVCAVIGGSGWLYHEYQERRIVQQLVPMAALQPPISFEPDEELSKDIQRQIELINFSRATTGAIDPISKHAAFVNLEYPPR